MKKAIVFIALIILSSCSSIILDEDEQNTQSNNFDLFWNDFDQHYGLFGVRNINWNDLYTMYQPQVNDNLSNEELWNVMSNLIEHLDDSHTTLYDGRGNRYTSGNVLNEQSKTEISEELIVSKYLDFHTEIPSENNLSFGKIKNKNIGYIYLGSMKGENPSIIDDIVNKLDNYNAIIFDIRQNTGGDDRYVARIAKAFSDGEHFIYTVQTRNGPNHSDFDEKKKYYTQYDENKIFPKPVLVLTDRATVSAAEVFLLHMKSFANVTQIGDTTAGDFSVVGNMRFLPNGWHYHYSIQKFLLPNGESLDGVGHIPDIYVKNSEVDITAKNDKVIDTAIEYLFNEYGIE